MAHGGAPRADFHRKPPSNMGHEQTWDLSKNLHDRISGAKILHTKSAYIETFFTEKETELMY